VRRILAGETLVDRKEAMLIMRRSFNTLRRRARKGELEKIKLPGSRKVWHRLKDVELMSGFGTTLVREETPQYLELLRRHCPHLFIP